MSYIVTAAVALFISAPVLATGSSIERKSSNTAVQSLPSLPSSALHSEKMDDTVGGGSINERERVQSGVDEDPSVVADDQDSTCFNPSLTRAHLFHALEGLHRYPNYLSRWSEQDIGRLEQSLLDQLDQVRRQREWSQDKQREASRLVRTLLEQDDGQRWKKLIAPPSSWERVQQSILSPEASRAIFGTRPWPTLHDVTSGRARVELPPGPLAAFMDEELPDVFSMQLLSQDFCLEICAYVQALARLDSTFGRRTVDLDRIGLAWVNDLLLALVMRPIARHLFTHSELGSADLDWRHGYVAGYAASPDPETATRRERLVTHTDDSEVTLNICLGMPDFVGGNLEFRGLRGTEEQGQLQGEYQPQIGKALIHAGRHFHDVTPVTFGNRFALIVWARSWKGTRSETCPCCWLNRRQSRHGGPCICGPQWN